MTNRMCTARVYSAIPVEIVSAVMADITSDIIILLLQILHKLYNTFIPYMAVY